jgi:hypothetical protein
MRCAGAGSVRRARTALDLVCRCLQARLRQENRQRSLDALIEVRRAMPLSLIAPATHRHFAANSVAGTATSCCFAGIAGVGVYYHRYACVVNKHRQGCLAPSPGAFSSLSRSYNPRCYHMQERHQPQQSR